MEPIRILIASSNRYSTRLIEQELQNLNIDICTAVVKSEPRLLDELNKNNYRLVIYDSLEDSDDLLAIITTVSNDFSSLPVIYLKNEKEKLLNNNFNNCKKFRAITKVNGYPKEISKSVLEISEYGYFLDRRNRRQNYRRKSDLINITANTLSHEINNPLMSILGAVELLLIDQKNIIDNDFRRKLEIIQDSAVRIEKVLKLLSNSSESMLISTKTGKLIDTNRLKSHKLQ